MCNIHTYTYTHTCFCTLIINEWYVYSILIIFIITSHTHILVPIGDQCKSEKVKKKPGTEGEGVSHPPHPPMVFLPALFLWLSLLPWPCHLKLHSPHRCRCADGRKVAASPTRPALWRPAPAIQFKWNLFGRWSSLCPKSLPSPRLQSLDFNKPPPPRRRPCLPPSLPASPVVCISTFFRGCLKHCFFRGLPYRAGSSPGPPPPRGLLLSPNSPSDLGRSQICFVYH